MFQDEYSMLLFNRRKFIFLFSAVVGCSFTPVFKPKNSPEYLKGKIEFPSPTNRESYILVSRLEENFGSQGKVLFKLTVSTSVGKKGFGSLGNISRYNLPGTASFVLTEISTGKVILNGQVNTFTSYSASAQTLATETADRSARDRLMKALADQITTTINMNYPADL